MKLDIRDVVILPMLGAVMFASKLLMELLPNIHLLGVLTIVYTLVYRSKALIAIYLFVFATGLYAGFALWWIPYLYVWTILWGIVMLLPKNMPRRVAPIVYMIVCGLHGFLYGMLYAPAQAIMFGYDFEFMLAWIVAGIPFDLMHGISNLGFGVLVIPLVTVIKKTDKRLK